MSDICGSGMWYDDLCFGGSANGAFPLSLGSIGECTVVASAKRGVRGVRQALSEDSPDEELEDRRSMVRAVGRFFSFEP